MGVRMGTGNGQAEEPHVKASDIPEQEILDACAAFHAGTGRTPDYALADKYPVKVIMAKMEKMVSRGKLEYGVSLRAAWPTEFYKRK